MEQQDTLETVIGGGNPEQADRHYAAALEHERNGMRTSAIDELRLAVENGSKIDQKHFFAIESFRNHENAADE